MSLQFCENCNKYIDMDLESEHFLELNNGDEVCAKKAIIHDDGIVTDEDGWVLGEVDN